MKRGIVIGTYVLLVLLVVVLEVQVSELNGKLQSLQTRVALLQVQASEADLAKMIEGIAYLTPGSDGYLVVKSDIGAITVALEDIKPYANGSRVSLRLGNLLSATINGMKAKLEWGPLGKDGLPVKEGAKSREVTFSQPLRPGAWTRADVVLESSPPTELGFVRVREVGHTGISLIGR